MGVFCHCPFFMVQFTAMKSQEGVFVLSEKQKRGYTHIQTVAKEVLKMLASGKTQREVSEHYGFKDRYVVKDFVKRHNRKQRRMEAGILPCRKGRPPKGYTTSDDEKDNEIKRLRMENQLLRSFLQTAGRR